LSRAPLLGPRASPRHGSDNDCATCIKVAWGTDVLFSADNAKGEGQTLAKMVCWFAPAEVLKMATAGNAELLALAGPRNPYPDGVGVVQEGALADLLLVDDPIANDNLIEDPARSFVVIMKDGKIYRNSLKCCGGDEMALHSWMFPTRSFQRMMGNDGGRQRRGAVRCSVIAALAAPTLATVRRAVRAFPIA